MRLAIIGTLGSGKTSVAQYLEKHEGFTRYSIANPLKILAVQMLGRPIEKSKDRKFLQDLGNYCKIPIELMSDSVKTQLFEWMQNCAFFDFWIDNFYTIFHKTFWIRMLFENYFFVKSLEDGDSIVFDDMRFLVEEQYAKNDDFKIIKLNASKELCIKRILARDSGYNEKDFDDVSEQEFQKIKADLTIDVTENKTIEQIVNEILDYFSPERIISIEEI